MNTFKRKKKALVDRKNIFVFVFWMIVNKILIAWRFKKFQIIGRQYLPKSGPFLLVSNHTSRWDGLIVYDLIGRPANFMVSPNELLGMQGAVLSSMGSFPADPRADLINHALNMFKKGEGIVVFPEGNIFRDNKTHQFKTGAAKIALAATESGIDLPIVPIAINYTSEGLAQIMLGQPVKAADYQKYSEESNVQAQRILSDRLHREVCFLRAGLGSVGDHLVLFVGTMRRRWLEIATLNFNRSVSEFVCTDNDSTLNNSEDNIVTEQGATLAASLSELKVS